VAVVAAVAVVVFVAAGLDQEAATRSREPALGIASRIFCGDMSGIKPRIHNVNFTNS
jgi:hypothetical protein